jgi:hypothetical protein
MLIHLGKSVSEFAKLQYALQAQWLHFLFTVYFRNVLTKNIVKYNKPDMKTSNIIVFAF